MKQLRVYSHRNKYTIDARRIGISNPTFGHYETEAEARKVADELLSKHTLGLVIVNQKPQKAADAIKSFLIRQDERVADGDISQSHCDEIERSLDYCASIKIDGISLKKWDLNKLCVKTARDDVSSALLRGIKAENKSKATAEKRIKFLKAFLNYCVMKGWADINPMDKVSLGMSAEVSNRAPRIQREKIQKLVSRLDSEPLVFQAAILLALSTGIRSGELRALTWDAINFDTAELHVRQAVAHNTTTVIKQPKTKRGNRILPLPQTAVSILRKHKLRSVCSQPSDYVFASSVGTPMLKKVLANCIKRACNTANIDTMLWGDMRHFFASVMLSELGEDWAEVAALMGHSSPAFTYRQYGHYSKNAEKQDKARAAAASAIFG